MTKRTKRGSKKENTPSSSTEEKLEQTARRISKDMWNLVNKSDCGDFELYCLSEDITSSDEEQPNKQPITVKKKTKISSKEVQCPVKEEEPISLKLEMPALLEECERQSTLPLTISPSEQPSCFFNMWRPPVISNRKSPGCGVLVAQAKAGGRVRSWDVYRSNAIFTQRATLPSGGQDMTPTKESSSTTSDRRGGPLQNFSGFLTDTSAGLSSKAATANSKQRTLSLLAYNIHENATPMQAVSLYSKYFVE